MKSVSKKEFILQGLDCANCAGKIEARVQKISGINNVSLNFMSKTLTIGIGATDKTSMIVSEISNIVKEIEPDVVVKEKSVSKGVKKVLILEGLGCANCANKMETSIKSLEGIKDASIDFS